MKTTKKIPKTFIGFLLVSLLIWILITFSKEYNTSIVFPVEYSNISQNKILQEAPIKEIEVLVKANGFKILRTRFNTKKIIINASSLIKKQGSKHFLLLNNQQKNIAKQLPSGVELKEIAKDTIYLDVGSLVSKKVAVKPNLKLNFSVGYDLSETIKITPDSLVVSGPEVLLSELNNIELSTLDLKDLKADFTNKVAVKPLENYKNLKFKTKEITISGKIEKFTEGSLNIKYKIINVPEGVVINTLSKEVEFTFVVGLSNFNKINENVIKIECDFSMTTNNNLGYLIPKLVQKPSEIKSYKITPKKIDFLIQK
ncbi:YbbR-like domain-containing protein [uncultured Polaribacter sp.]|uniref:YbbR-like domain-containing protein n=1 Tax=uncultured Polaribacter sp. TaxID=174711 RepID=UPI0026094834|nr:YbbR-like domain-containing protein [uncultured Polaribacter sp.]